MDRYTRHQLKQDDFQNTIDSLQVFFEEHLREIIVSVAVVIIVAGATIGWRTYSSRQEAAANAQLQQAIGTFNAYVGAPQQNSLMPSGMMFPTANAKYSQALNEFSTVAAKYSRTKAAKYAQVHMAICAAQLGNENTAIKQLQDLSQTGDKGVASLAQFSLAGELAKTGKTGEAAKIYQNLADRPTTMVPRATALLALADAYRTSQPGRAREIYNQVQQEFGSNTVIAADLKQQIASLPK